MQRAILKIAVLLSVMGTGGYTLYKVNEKLPVQTPDGNDPQKWAAVGDGQSTANEGDAQQLGNVEIGPSTDAANVGGFAFPPADQNEPGAGPAARFAALDNRMTDPPLTARRPGARDDLASPTFGASDGSAATGDPIAGVGETASSVSSDPFSGPAGQVEQVAADESTADNSGGNPFLSFADVSVPEQAVPEQGEPAPLNGPGSSAEPTVEAAAEVTPEPGAGAALAAAPPAPRTRTAPALTLATEPADSTAFGAAGAVTTEPAEDAAPAADAAAAEGSSDPFGAGAPGVTFDPGPAGVSADEGTASPVLELGPAAREPVANEPSLPEQPSEPAPDYGPGITGFGPLEATETDPPAVSENERPAAGGVEPNRLPPIEEKAPAPKTALRTREFAPLQPAPQAEPFTKIIPNPLPEQSGPGGPRPEFVGDATLDGAATGPQQPELTIQKVAPNNATVGDPLVYAIKVKNVGNSTAHDVIVEDRIPRGTNLEGTIPQAELTDRKLVWQLGHMEPGTEKTIRIKVIPTEAGEIGSVATVRFVAEVAATTKITTPSLTMDVQGPSEVAVGEQATFHFHIANTGDGEARNVYIRNLLPDGFEHAGGHDIEYDIGVLRPGETREVDLAVKAVGDGPQTLESHLNTGTTKRTQTEAAVNVIKSRLLIQRQGPKRRFVGRPAEYTTVVSNRSSAVLKNVSVIEQLPAGMELAAVPEGGHWDKQRRTITWRIAQLAAGEQTALKTSVIASQQNVLQWLVQASDAAGNRAQLTSSLEVAGFASLAVDLEHNGRPVGVGEQVALQLTVKNRGTGSAAGVEATFEIPPHLEFVNAEGPSDFHQDGQKVQFAALDELAANGEQTYKIVLTAREPGNTAVTAQLSTSDGSQPLQHTEQVIVEGDGP